MRTVLRKVGFYDKIRIENLYDDVFRTLLNEMFGEHYTGKEKIIPTAEIHYLNQQDGYEEKRVTDGSFLVKTAYEKASAFKSRLSED